MESVMYNKKFDTLKVYRSFTFIKLRKFRKELKNKSGNFV